jgi:hypothetical protein
LHYRHETTTTIYSKLLSTSLRYLEQRTPVNQTTKQPRQPPAYLILTSYTYLQLLILPYPFPSQCPGHRTPQILQSLVQAKANHLPNRKNKTQLPSWRRMMNLRISHPKVYHYLFKMLILFSSLFREALFKLRKMEFTKAE